MRKVKKKNKTSSRYSKLAEMVDSEKLYDVTEALALVKQTASTKFAETVDLAIRLGIDAKKSDQNVRGTTNLPHGTGKNQRVAVLAKGDLAAEATAAGADIVGEEDLIKKIQEGWKDFDVMLATNDMAPQIGKVGRFLGTKTPNKKNGTVTDSIGQTVKEIKAATRIEYRIDKAGVIHLPVGKANFTEDQLGENIKSALDAVIRAKPSSSKGRYLRSLTISTTMGPGIKLDPTLATKFSGH
ncbi:MAG: 50S ribosomal protein L1 [Fimbriimonadaceae bacterium]|nr:50S ribosomal protein L1 [Fimbriimonadaceae bacterium]